MMLILSLRANGAMAERGRCGILTPAIEGKPWEVQVKFFYSLMPADALSNLNRCLHCGALARLGSNPDLYF